MQHLEGSGTPVLYIGRTVLKGYGRTVLINVNSVDWLGGWGVQNPVRYVRLRPLQRSDVAYYW